MTTFNRQRSLEYTILHARPTQSVMRDLPRTQQAVSVGRVHEVVLAALGAVRDGVPPHALRDAHQEAALGLLREDLLRLRSGDQTLNVRTALLILSISLGNS